MKMAYKYLVTGVVASVLFACSDIKSPSADPLEYSEILFKLRFGSKGVMVVTGDTFTIKATATFADSSQKIVDPSHITWRSVDAARVRVDESGKITAGPVASSPTNIIATYTYKDVTKADTIPIYVTATRLNANEAKIILLDSTKVGALATNATARLRVDLFRDGEIVQKGVALPLTVPDGIRMRSVPISGSPGQFEYFVINEKSILGDFYIHASLNLYGTEVKDSVQFTGIYPAGGLLITMARNADGDIIFGEELSPNDPIRYLQPCAVVKFLVVTQGPPMDLVFSDSLPGPEKTCDVLLDSELNPGGSPLGANQVFGNVINIRTGAVTVVRRSSTIGEVSYYARDAVTKTRLKISGKYFQK